MITMDKLNGINEDFFKGWSKEVVIVMKCFQATLLLTDTFEEEDFEDAVELYQRMLGEIGLVTTDYENRCFVAKIWEHIFGNTEYVKEYNMDDLED